MGDCDFGGSVENRRRSPVIAEDTVEGMGTCQEAERGAGVEVPEPVDDVGVWSSL